MSRTQRWTWGRGLEVHMLFLLKFHPLLPYYTILKEHMKRYAGSVFQNCLCGSFLLRFLPWKVPTNSLTFVRAVSHLLCSLTAESPPNFLTSRGLVTWSSDQEQHSPSDGWKRKILKNTKHNKNVFWHKSFLRWYFICSELNTYSLRRLKPSSNFVAQYPKRLWFFQLLKQINVG